MSRVLADPALSDDRLEAIRLWLRAMRDGRAERLPDRVVIHNPRSDRDPPVRLALQRAEGGWTLPANAGCRQGAVLAGGKQCEIRLPSSSRGALVFRFAASAGLEPQPVRLVLGEDLPSAAFGFEAEREAAHVTDPASPCRRSPSQTPAHGRFLCFTGL